MFLLLHHMELGSLLNQHLLHDGCLRLVSQEGTPGARACDHTAGARWDGRLHRCCGPRQSHLVLLLHKQRESLVTEGARGLGKSWLVNNMPRVCGRGLELEESKSPCLCLTLSAAGGRFLGSHVVTRSSEAPQIKQEHLTIR